MTQFTGNPHSVSTLQDAPAASASARCAHRTQQGRRCRLPISDTVSGLCGRHAQLRRQHLDSDDLSGDLLGEVAELQSAGEVTDFLSSLLVLLAQGRVSVRRAAVLCYIAGQLIRGFREAERYATPQQVLIDIDSAVARRARGLAPSAPAHASAQAQAQP